MVGVGLQVGAHLGAGRVAVRPVGEAESRQAAEVSRGEQGEAVPPVGPALPDAAGVDDQHPDVLLAGEVVGGAEAGLTGTDHQDVHLPRLGTVGFRHHQRGSCVVDASAGARNVACRPPNAAAARWVRPITTGIQRHRAVVSVVRVDGNVTSKNYAPAPRTPSP